MVSSAITLGVNLVALAVLVAVNRIVPGAALAALTAAAPRALRLIVRGRLLLATLFVRFRDVGQVWELVLQMLFYASPIIYPVSSSRTGSG